MPGGVGGAAPRGVPLSRSLALRVVCRDAPRRPLIAIPVVRDHGIEVSEFDDEPISAGYIALFVVCNFLDEIDDATPELRILDLHDQR